MKSQTVFWWHFSLNLSNFNTKIIIKNKMIVDYVFQIK
jgi:hypothetical protein